MSGYNSLFKTCNFKLLLSSPSHKDLEFFIQETSFPGITLGAIEYSFQSLKYYSPGDSITFEKLTTTILVDEEMKVMDDLLSTINLTHNPETNLYKIDPVLFDGTLLINTNKNNPLRKIRFKDMWLETFNELQLLTNSTDDNPSVITAGWNYSYYTFEKI